MKTYDSFMPTKHEYIRDVLFDALMADGNKTQQVHHSLCCLLIDNIDHA